MKRMQACSLAVLLILAAVIMAPTATAQLGQYDCSECRKICWMGLWVLESCDYFCVQFDTGKGYRECEAGYGWCFQRDKCVTFIA